MSERLRPVKTTKGYVIHDQGNQKILAELPECNVGYVQGVCDRLNERVFARNYINTIKKRLSVNATRYQNE